jgi:LysR family transcriptional activator of nhaA
MADLNYHHLRYFWAVAHDGSLTRTAARLNLSQSALSTQIKALEARLGLDLFERRGRQLILTEAGRIVLDHADTIFATGREMLDTLKGANAGQQVLRVGAAGTLSRNFQLQFLSPVLGRDDVEVILRSGAAAELYPALDALNLDVILTTRAPARDVATQYLAHRLDQQEVALIGTPARLAGDSDLRALVAAHPVILPTADSSIRVGFDALMDRWEIRPRIAAEVDDMAMIRLLARQDVGLAVVPPIVVRDELTSGRLASAGDLGLTEAFYAVTLQRRFPNPLVADLLRPAPARAPV